MYNPVLILNEQPIEILNHFTYKIGSLGIITLILHTSAGFVKGLRASIWQG
jgi:hypothetical protein